MLSPRKKIGFRGMIMHLAWDILNSKMPEGHSYVVVSYWTVGLLLRKVVYVGDRD